MLQGKSQVLISELKSIINRQNSYNNSKYKIIDTDDNSYDGIIVTQELLNGGYKDVPKLKYSLEQQKSKIITHVNQTYFYVRDDKHVGLPARVGDAIVWGDSFSGLRVIFKKDIKTVDEVVPLIETILVDEDISRSINVFAVPIPEIWGTIPSGILTLSTDAQKRLGITPVAGEYKVESDSHIGTISYIETEEYKVQIQITDEDLNYIKTGEEIDREDSFLSGLYHAGIISFREDTEHPVLTCPKTGNSYKLIVGRDIKVKQDGSFVVE